MVIILTLVLAQCFLRSGDTKGPCSTILMKWKTFSESSLVWADPGEDQDSDTVDLRITQDPDLPIPLPPTTESHTLTLTIHTGGKFDLEITYNL